ncbi:MAG TPA: hypothetical protein VLX90_04365, partial [Steroidobacteraceae bacterium]|nr:hypothetical protein [Steroidobacteraceae bacterium]
MRHPTVWRAWQISLALLVALVSSGSAFADNDARESREREMLHRTQEALHQAQADNAELARARTDAEQKLQVALSDLATARAGSKSQQASLHADLQSARTSNEELRGRLEESERRLSAAVGDRKDTATRLAAREAELKQARQALEQSKSANASCEAKNLKLYEYSQGLLQQYQRKGVWAALKQKEPTLGIGKVG